MASHGVYIHINVVNVTRWGGRQLRAQRRVMVYSQIILLLTLGLDKTLASSLATALGGWVDTHCACSISPTLRAHDLTLSHPPRQQQPLSRSSDHPPSPVMVVAFVLKSTRCFGSGPQVSVGFPLSSLSVTDTGPGNQTSVVQYTSKQVTFIFGP